VGCHKTKTVFPGAARPLWKVFNDGPDGRWLRPHGNFTPPHAYGAATNAVKRSSRKYPAVRKIVARRPATACLPQRCSRSFPCGRDARLKSRGALCGVAPSRNERIRAIGIQLSTYIGGKNSFQ